MDLAAYSSRGRYNRQELKLLLLGDQPEDLDIASDMDSDDYLLKPVQPRKLQAAVERCLGAS